MGLLELAPNGKAHLIPVTIMVDGKFYDAAAYKASPVPMALETGTVYEAVRSGVTQGLFTVSGALAGENTSGENTWRGDGKWQSQAEIQAAAARKKALQVSEKAQAAKAKEDQDAPPVLRRAGSANSKTSAPDSGKTTAPQSEPKSVPAAPGGNTPSGSSAPTTTASTTDSSSSPASSASSSSPSIPVDDENDPDRPHLRRSNAPADTKDKPVPPANASSSTTSTPAKAAAAVASSVSSSSSGVQLIPAVSDSGGPESRPYTFDLKPDEEVKFRNKMLALAAIEVRAHIKSVASETTMAAPSKSSSVHPTAHTRKPAKPPEPTFEDVQLHVFDLSNSNEPVLVLTAKAHMPAHAAKGTPDGAAQPYLLTLVAREDIYGDLHKALSNITDSQHLGVMPRLDLIDAVDVDGDGRGELLFRRVSDVGSGYIVYRVIGNQLWPLFEGAIT